jgi:hypothetical protein
LSDFKVLRGGKFPFPNCSFVILTARQPASRTVSRAPVYHILWVRGFRGHTISGRGFNLFKPLQRHFRATPSLPSGHSRTAIPAMETPQPGEIAEGLRRSEAGGAAASLAARRNASDGFGGGRFPKSGGRGRLGHGDFPVSRMTMKSSSTKSGVSEINY